MAENLKIVIGGEVSGAVQAMSAVEQRSIILTKRIETLQRVAASTTSFEKMDKALNLLKISQQELSRLNPGNNFNKLTTGSNAATLSLVNLGRVVQDAPFGFIGIANNLNPLLEGFQRLRAQTGSAGGAFKALGASLTGAGGLGIAISVVSTALILFGDKLFGTKVKAEESEAALKKYKKVLEDIADVAKQIQQNANFADALADLNTKIFGLGEVLNLRGQSVAQREVTAALRAQLEAQKREYDASIKDKKLTDEDKVKLEEDYIQKRKELNDKINDSEEKQRLIYRRIELQKVTDKKEANEKFKQQNEKFVNDVIAKGKELQDFFEVPVQFRFSGVALKQTQFEQSLKIIDLFDKGGLRLKIPISSIDITGPDDPTLRDRIFKQVEGAIEASQAGIVQFKVEPSIEIPANTTIVKMQDELNKILGPKRAPLLDFRGDPGEELKKATKAIKDFNTQQEIAFSLAQSLTSAFSEFFTQLSEGGNAFKAFGTLVRTVLAQVIQQLVRAVITAFFLKALTPGGAGSLGTSIGTLGNLLGRRAAGGPVKAGLPYEVGESSRELFIPEVNGRIVPNFNGFQTPVFNRPEISAFNRKRVVIRGRELRLVGQRTLDSQSRLGVR